MTSPSTVAPVSTSLMSFDGTIGSTIHNTRQSSAWHDRTANRRSASCGDESQRTSISQCGQETRNQHSELTAKGVSRQDSTSQVIKSVFVQGVGWASQVSTPLESFFWFHYVHYMYVGYFLEDLDKCLRKIKVYLFLVGQYRFL